MSSEAATCTRIAQAWLEQSPLFLDTETTGLRADDEVVQIAVTLANGEPVLNTLVRPKKYIPPEATAIHGITNQMVKTAPPADAVMKRLCQVINGRTVCIYNADFDTRLIAQTCRKWGVLEPHYAPKCVMLLHAKYAGEWSEYHNDYRWWKLEDAVRRYGLGDYAAHGALADTQMTARLLMHMAGMPAV